MDIIILSAVISFLALDTTIAFQILLSSPIFSCPILGWILGDIQLGFEMGFLLQLLWLGRIPAGAYIVPEGNIASMVVTALVLLNQNQGFPNTTLTLAFCEGIFIGYVGALITLSYRKLNNRILDLIIKQIQKIHFKTTLLLETGSMFLYFMLVFFVVLITFFISQQILPSIIPMVGNLWEEKLRIVKPLILGMGLAFILPIFIDAIFKSQGRKIEKN